MTILAKNLCWKKKNNKKKKKKKKKKTNPKNTKKKTKAQQQPFFHIIYYYTHVQEKNIWNTKPPQYSSIMGDIYMSSPYYI